MWFYLPEHHHKKRMLFARIRPYRRLARRQNASSLASMSWGERRSVAFHHQKRQAVHAVEDGFQVFSIVHQTCFRKGAENQFSIAVHKQLADLEPHFLPQRKLLPVFRIVLHTIIRISDPFRDR